MHEGGGGALIVFLLVFVRFNLQGWLDGIYRYINHSPARVQFHEIFLGLNHCVLLPSLPRSAISLNASKNSSSS